MTAFLRAYLIGLVTWIDLPLGCLLLLLTYHLTGGGWGLALGGPMEAAVRTLPLLALLFVPVLLDLEAVFPWARHAFLAEHDVVGKKAAYLDATFFTARAAVYWVTWVALAFALTSPHRGGALAERPRSKGLAAAGVILYALSASFAAVDWIVSLEPTFYSSAFGMLAMSGQAVMGFAFATLATLALTAAPGRTDVLREERLIGHGTILLSLVLIWIYLAFMQYLVIWSGNMPHHAEWYVRRGEGVQAGVIGAIYLLHGVLPLVVLLSPRARASWRVVGGLCAVLLAVRVLDTVWLMAPAFEHGPHAPPGWLTGAAIVALGAVWLLAFLWQLAGRARGVAADIEEAGCDGGG